MIQIDLVAKPNTDTQEDPVSEPRDLVDGYSLFELLGLKISEKKADAYLQEVVMQVLRMVLTRMNMEKSLSTQEMEEISEKASVREGLFSVEAKFLEEKPQFYEYFVEEINEYKIRALIAQLESQTVGRVAESDPEMAKIVDELQQSIVNLYKSKFDISFRLYNDNLNKWMDKQTQ